MISYDMEFDNIENNPSDHETNFYVNTRITTGATQKCVGSSEQNKMENDEGQYEHLRFERKVLESTPDIQEDTIRKIKVIGSIFSALLIALYIGVIALVIVISVPKEQDGGWSDWEIWSTCSESCGGGIRSRNRSCSNPSPSLYGKQCIGNFEQVSQCNKQLCPGTDGGWSNWEIWSTCSESCGGGIKSRKRSCSNPSPSLYGKQCIGNFEQVSLCNKQLCPGTDGGWSNWEIWSTCSESCGGGIKSRKRSCSNPSPSLYGKQCIGNFEQVSLCNKQMCPGTDGGWSNWEIWSTCSESCGGGIKSRKRSCSNPSPSLYGKQCIGNFEQVSLCNKQMCPGTDGGWSVWEGWGTCTDSCGGGVRTRSRSCTNPIPSLTGRPCRGDYTDVSTCNKKVCPEHNVAFTAYDIYRNSSGYSNLLFRRTHTNIGDGYNTTTGQFTCHIPGVYHFVVTLTKVYQDINSISAYLRINGSNKLYLHLDPKDDGSNEVGMYMMTGAGTFHLNQNDVVYVNSISDYFYNGRYSYFTGFLITPDQ